MVLCTLGIITGIISPFVLWIIFQHDVKLLSPVHKCLQIFTQAYFTLAMVVPNCVKASNIDFHYAFIMMQLACAASPIAKPVLPLVLGQTALVVAMNFARGTTSKRRFPFFSLCNTFFAASAALSLFYLGENCFSGPLPAWFWLTVELLGMPVFCCCVHLLDEHLHAAMLASLQLQEAKELYLAACALLRSCCEVVVELDADRRIVSQEPDLGSYLMLGVSSLQGRLLDEFIPDEGGRKALRESFERKRQDSSLNLAETMQVNLRDGWNNPLRAELLWFRFRRADGSEHYMVGVRDFGEHSPHRSGHETQQDSFPVVTGEDESLNTPAASSSCEAETLDCVNEIMAIVDCEQRGYPVVSVSPAFVSQIGRLPLGEPLLDHVTKPQKVLLWVQESLNLAFHGEETPQCRISFRMPQGRVNMLCHLLVSSSTPFELKRTCFCFSKPTLAETIGKRTSGSSSSSSEEPHQLRGTPNAAPLAFGRAVSL